MQVINRSGEKPKVLSASSLKGNEVFNTIGEGLGKIEDIVIDLYSGRVAYAVLSFGGGFLGMGEKLFAVPWKAMNLDADKNRFILNIDKQTLEKAEGFDKHNWPDFADPAWAKRVDEYYGLRPDKS